MVLASVWVAATCLLVFFLSSLLHCSPHPAPSNIIEMICLFGAILMFIFVCCNFIHVFLSKVDFTRMLNVLPVCGSVKNIKSFSHGKFFLRDHLLLRLDYVAPKKVFGFCGWLTKKETIPSTLSCCDFFNSFYWYLCALFSGNNSIFVSKLLLDCVSPVLSGQEKNPPPCLLRKVLIPKFDFSSLKSSGDWTFV